MNTIHVESARPGAFPQVVKTRSHTFYADVGTASGGEDAAPGPHDYFDSALATCKALTAVMFAKKNGIPLERVESSVERDERDEGSGIYRLRSRVVFHGPLSEAQRATLYRVITKCPIHKLMTTCEVQIEVVAP
jgi:putative redox protein